MPAVNVIEEIFIVADPGEVRAVVCEAAQWSAWLPGLSLSPYHDRGRLGVRWTVSGDLAGTAEVWLEEHGDGVIVHAYLRATASSREARRLRSDRNVNERYALPLKRGLFVVKDRLEGDRPPGSARLPLGERVVSASESGQVDSKGKAPDGRSDHVEHPDLR